MNLIERCPHFRGQNVHNTNVWDSTIILYRGVLISGHCPGSHKVIIINLYYYNYIALYCTMYCILYIMYYILCIVLYCKIIN